MNKSNLVHLGLILLTLTAPTSAAAIDLDSLLVRSIGGPAALDSVRTLKAYRSEGSMSLNGTEGKYVEYFMAPDKIRTQLELPGFQLVQGFDGHNAWRLDHNGQVAVLSGSEAAEIISAAYLASFSYLVTERIAGSRRYGGIDTIDGEALHKVVFYPLDTDSVSCYYDQSTGRMRMQISRIDEMIMRAECHDFQPVGGILWPFHQLATAEGVPLTMELTYQHVDLNLPLEDSLFVVPGARASDFRFPTGVEAVTIPIDYHNGHVRVTATINGRQKAWFILDSGASANMLNESVTEELGLVTVGTMPAKGLGGYEEIDLVQTDSIQIGDLILLGQVAGSLELDHLGSVGPDGLPFGGVLGYDFLSRFPVCIDYQNLQLTVYNPEAFVAPPGGVEVPFYLTLSIPTVAATLEGIEGEYIVDLGNPFGLIVHPLFAEAHDLIEKLDHVRDAGMAIGGIGGEIRSRTGLADLFRLGEVEVSDLTVLLAEGSGGLTQSEDLAGNIGNLVLENFRVLLDYAGRRLILYQADG